MEKYLKFLRKLPKGLRLKVIDVVVKIGEGDLKGFDVKPFKGKEGFYRCRVGKIRIVFAKTEGGNHIYDIGFRGNIYKK